MVDCKLLCLIPCRLLGWCNMEATYMSFSKQQSMELNGIFHKRLTIIYTPSWRDKMDSVDKFFRESHYNIVRILLGINGLWPYYTTARRWGIYFALLLMLGSGMTFEVYIRKSNYHEAFSIFDFTILLPKNVINWKLYEYYYVFLDIVWQLL